MTNCILRSIVLSALLISTLSSKVIPEVYDIKDVSYEFGIRKTILKKHPHLLLQFCYVDSTENIILGVLLDKKNHRMFIYDTDKGLKISVPPQEELIKKGMHTKTGRLFDPEIVKTYTYTITLDGGRERNDKDFLEYTIGYWLKLPTEGEIEIVFTYDKKLSFVLSADSDQNCKVIMKPLVKK